MKIKIGNKLVGEGQPCFIVAEIGINHNGDISNVKKLIDVAVNAGCDAVKFQKRTVDIVYTKEELAVLRPSPFGDTNGDLKRGLELTYDDYKEIDKYCKEENIIWFASCWDEDSVDFISKFNTPCYKIASASLTDDNLLIHTAKQGKPVLLSTGMSTLEQIKHAIKVIEGAGNNEIIIYHCTSTYPTDCGESNLNVMHKLAIEHNYNIAYSGHERGLLPSILAASMGACSVERHITLDRTMWGSDQAFSLEPRGVRLLVRDIREIFSIMGNGDKVVYDSELPIIKKLRRK